MEAIGKLSGGIAHDFNNILALILGNAEIIAGEASRGSLTQDAAADIIEAADGGSKLVTRMLQYARGESSESEDVQLNTAIEGVVALLGRTISDRVNIQTDLSAAVGRVHLDRPLFETALMNLILNARDAMEGSGTITVTTRRRANAGPQLGTVAAVSVSDSGSGMDEATAARAFEPFFTTKAEGRGNGLGLAMVYNFVKQAGGDISIDTALGRGTTVNMLLPIDEPAVRSAARPDERLRILLVDDEAKIRKVLALHLQRAGYEVIEAAAAEEALALIDDGLAPAMLLSDIRLREGMTGVQLTELLVDRGSRFPMLLMTGFAEELSAGSEQIGGITVLRKPFRTDDLLAAVERLIEAAPAAGTKGRKSSVPAARRRIP
jgi:CheY-like chemotaxis protein